MLLIKIIIVLKIINIFGWVWEMGKFKVSFYRIVILFSCCFFEKVFGLKLFIGVVKVFSWVVFGCVFFIVLLDDVIVG